MAQIPDSTIQSLVAAATELKKRADVAASHADKLQLYNGQTLQGSYEDRLRAELQACEKELANAINLLGRPTAVAAR